uniref:Cationic amino acid transporter C-terminal domain-containing protein n=1 Tax=Sus scrofa TaxID=9823 RepID=A0A4X1SPA0_PIG
MEQTIATSTRIETQNRTSCPFLAERPLPKGRASSTLCGMLDQYVRQFCEKLVRRRPLEPRDESEIPTPHPNIFSLLVFGVNRTLSVGVYILAGSVAMYVAGPGIIVSLVVTRFFSMLSGFYFAEFGARVPRSGSVYLYSYVTMGQLHTFITGWTLILNFVLATAYLTRAWSYTFDSLIGNHISQKLEGTFSEHTPSFLAPYPDFVALALVLLMAGLVLLGVHDSALVSKVSAGINVLLLSFMILSGFIKGDLHNWQLTEQDYKLATSGSSDSYSLGPLGSGGFVPFGFEGILQGAAMPFYSFFGLNAIITAGNMVFMCPFRLCPVWDALEQWGWQLMRLLLEVGGGRILNDFTAVCFPDLMFPTPCRERNPQPSAFHPLEHRDLHLQLLFFFFFFFFFFVFLLFLWAAPVAYGGSQVRGAIGAVATGLRQSHSNTGSEPCLQPTPQLTATPDHQPTVQGQGPNPQPYGS